MNGTKSNILTTRS